MCYLHTPCLKFDMFCSSVCIVHGYYGDIGVCLDSRHVLVFLVCIYLHDLAFR